MIEIYTRDGCNFCEKAKELLSIEKEPYIEINLTKGEATREQVLERIGGTGAWLPVVIVDDKYIGGYENLVEHFAKEQLENGH